MDELVQLMENVFKPVLSSFEPNVRLCRFYKNKALFFLGIGNMSNGRRSICMPAPKRTKRLYPGVDTGF